MNLIPLKHQLTKVIQAKILSNKLSNFTNRQLVLKIVAKEIPQRI